MKVDRIKFHVEDLDGPNCAEAIKKKLSGVHGVSAASIDLNSKEVAVSVSYPQSCESVYCAVEDLGYHIIVR
jgi:copper chaperone CopZ